MAAGEHHGVRMATNEIFIEAPPEQVFELLSDPRSYGEWVVGAHSIRTADGEWPAPGSAFDHRVGVGPLTLNDHTSVISSRWPATIELLARASPLPPARVTLRLHRKGQGTRLTMVEAPANRLLSLMLGPVGHWMLWLRNVESLRRLKLLAEGEAPLPAGRLPERDGHGDG
ncbi:MAG: SRPBCC family protein [Actinomycetota bacterium]|nr:SRPBCC family protein [Actinomycetota bacterium]